MLFSKLLALENVNWSYPQVEKEFEALVKIRYNMKAALANIKIKNNCTEIEFLEEVLSVYEKYDINGHIIWKKDK